MVGQLRDEVGDRSDERIDELGRRRRNAILLCSLPTSSSLTPTIEKVGDDKRQSEERNQPDTEVDPMSDPHSDGWSNR